MQLPKYEQSSFVLRAFHPKDTREYFRLVNENREHLQQYFPTTLRNVTTLESTHSYLEGLYNDMKLGKFFLFFVEYSSSSQLVGTVFLREPDAASRKAEMGYFIDHRFTGVGLASWGLDCASDFAFHHLHLNKVFVRIAEENYASIRVAEKAGFRLEGCLREDFLSASGKLIDVLYFGKLKRENRESKL